MNLSFAPQATAWLGRTGGRVATLAARVPRRLLALPLALLVALVVLAINETSHATSMRALQRVQQHAEAIARLESVMRRLLDAESGQRGYLITGRRIYLEPYEQAAADTAEALAWLHDQLAQDPVSAALVQQLQGHANAKLDELAAAVGAFDAGRRSFTQTLLESDTALHNTARLREVQAQLAAREQAQLAATRLALLNTLQTSRIGVNATAALGVLALLMLLRQTAALAHIQGRHAQALQEERDRLEAEVVHRTAELGELARHLHTVRDDECSRLARQLHEELGSVLRAARTDVAQLRHGLGAVPPAVEERLDHLKAGIDDGIALKRRIIDHLRPSSLSERGLVAALEIQLREFSGRTGVKVHSDLQALPLSDGAQVTAYRLVQEALTNIAKYAQARSVQVTLKAGPGGMARLTVADDGRGFDPRAPRRSAHGLMGMRYRVEAVGGTLEVRSAPGRGTHIEASLSPQAHSVRYPPGGLSASGPAEPVPRREA